MAQTPGTRIVNSRQYLPADLQISSWDSVASFAESLLVREPADLAEVEKWVLDYSELDAALYEERAWRFIRMSCDTRDEAASEAYRAFVTGIQPRFEIFSETLMKKLSSFSAFAQLDHGQYQVLMRTVMNYLRIYREENVSLFTEIQTLSREFDKIASMLEIEFNGERTTLARAVRMLELKDRDTRREIWNKIDRRRLQERERLDTLFSDLLVLRNQAALNAGFKSYSDYSYALLGRFDYTRDDINRFCDAIGEVVTPYYEKSLKKRMEKLGVDVLYPWDLMVDLWGDQPLSPFKSGEELVNKSEAVFTRLNPVMGRLVHTMNEMGHLDLVNRLGKAPGGYSYSLPETGIPFVFMNAAGSQIDLTTMMHEMGHAAHAYLTRDIRVYAHRKMPAEIAELASMTLEFITQDNWDIFYENPGDLVRARREQITRPFNLLPWIASIDRIQHWAYDHPVHSAEERSEAWKKIYTTYHGDLIRWHDETSLGCFWQKQGHVFDMPFYYIEYGIAQLGALAIWRNYKRDPRKCMEAYLKALSIGYSKPIPDVYRAAGIRFDLSAPYLRELCEFLQEEIDKLDEVNP